MLSKELNTSMAFPGGPREGGARYADGETLAATKQLKMYDDLS